MSLFLCQGVGGEVVSISSAKENSFVWYNFVRDQANTWLGAKVATTDTGSSTRTWAWEDSTAWTYDNWLSTASGGNAGIANNHNCVHMQKADTQQWDDVNCAGKKPYICKK